MDPRIGILQTEQGVVFYAFAHGYDKPETRGSRAEVEHALGLRAKPAPRKTTIKLYQVKVTPAVVGYTSTGYGGGSETHGAYTVEVYAQNAKEAISKARRQRRDEEGRFAVSATFRATCVTEH